MCICWLYTESIMKKRHWAEFHQIKREMRGLLIVSLISIVSYVILSIWHYDVEGAYDYLHLYRCDQIIRDKTFIWIILS